MEIDIVGRDGQKSAKRDLEMIDLQAEVADVAAVRHKKGRSTLLFEGHADIEASRDAKFISIGPIRDIHAAAGGALDGGGFHANGHGGFEHDLSVFKTGAEVAELHGR